MFFVMRVKESRYQKNDSTHRRLCTLNYIMHCLSGSLHHELYIAASFFLIKVTVAVVYIIVHLCFVCCA